VGREEWGVVVGKEELDAAPRVAASTRRAVAARAAQACCAIFAWLEPSRLCFATTSPICASVLCPSSAPILLHSAARHHERE
jgi:hypothetical protein